ncbi:HIT family protein [Phaeodactylibacter luteus]|uniref:HIT family protein n=1 Tax=Phaeodactylibacter luteus TaxID=1564516 RepID=A0A5C6RN69_9BACT|nr:HIT family protein [Phaeodactylibacter luteus]TXB63090.1 HIT family protein [Phaeodactylibacter luteus]
MPTIFSKIIAGEIPCYKVAEDEHYFAFLDIRPLAKGHTLVVPKTEVDYLFDVSDDLLAGMLPFSKRVARALEQAVTCKRVGLMVIGLEVPHAHIHLVPFTHESEISITRKPLELGSAEMQAIAQAAREAFE